MDLPAPDPMQVTLTLLSLILAFAAVVKVIVPIWRWFGRAGRRVSGAIDNLGGRAAFTDPATGEMVPAIPPIGERLTSIDSRLDSLLDVNTRLDHHQRSILHLEERQAKTEETVDLLKTAAAERIVTKDESAQMWRAIANNDAIDGEANE